MQKILVVDDDREMCLLLNRFLSRNGYDVTEIYSGKKALDYLRANAPDLVISDFRLDDMDGLELLTRIKEMYPATPVIMITGYSDIKTSVKAMKMGAYDYVTKPLLPEEILITIQQALSADAPVMATPVSAPVTAGEQRSPAVAVVRDYDRPPSRNNQYIFGDTESFRHILKQIDLVAPTNYNVIIYGESGSGKEAIAVEIHKRSKRADKPFIAIDCGALSKELAGSELFGHEKGAFTGALNQKIGSFELANGGTIFLDEISNLSYGIQVSLLRVVQERKMRRVGGVKDIELDVRIVVASNEKLWNATRNGKFREDLYHRFNEFTIDVPPLRERKDDIQLFADFFLQMTNEELGKKVKGFSPDVMNIFRSYQWYGNLRELKNVIKRATLLTEGDYVELHSLPFEIAHYNRLQFEEANGQQTQEQPSVQPQPTYTAPVRTKETSLKEVSIDAEYQMILDALKEANYNKSKAARILNIDRKTLYNKMSQYKELKNN
jgi:two-component system, NtrC family, response regulator HydG